MFFLSKLAKLFISRIRSFFVFFREMQVSVTGPDSKLHYREMQIFLLLKFSVKRRDYDMSESWG